MNIEIIDPNLREQLDKPATKKTRKPRVITQEHKEKLRANAQKARSKVAQLVNQGKKVTTEDDEVLDLEATDLEETQKKATAYEEKLSSQFEALKSFIGSELDKREQARLERLENKRKEKEEKKKTKVPKASAVEEIKTLLVKKEIDHKAQLDSQRDTFLKHLNKLRAGV